MARSPKTGSVDRPAWSRHARRRWAERFPHLDPVEEWFTAMTKAGVPGKSRRRQIREQCPWHARRGFISPSFQEFYYRISRSGVVFVVVPGYLILTVFPLGAPLSP